MPKTAVKFGQELQLVLQPMIVKPSHIGGVVVSCLAAGVIIYLIMPQSLQESVACMCGAVQHLTHDFNRLVALVKSCNGTRTFLFDRLMPTSSSSSIAAGHRSPILSPNDSG